MQEANKNSVIPPIPQQELDDETKTAMRTDLDNMFQAVEMKRKTLNTKQFIDDNKLRQFKMELLKKFYDILQRAGVDPNDQESISKFLSELEEQDPDLVQLFEEAISTLDPDVSGQVGTDNVPEEEAGGLTDQFSNLRNQVLRQ